MSGLTENSDSVNKGTAVIESPIKILVRGRHKMRTEDEFLFEPHPEFDELWLYHRAKVILAAELSVGENIQLEYTVKGLSDMSEEPVHMSVYVKSVERIARDPHDPVWEADFAAYRYKLKQGVADDPWIEIGAGRDVRATQK